MRKLSRFCNIMTVVAFAMLLASSCKKDIMTYASDDFVFFEGDSVVYPFRFMPASLTKDTVNVRILLTGKVADKDREVSFQVEDSSTAVEGTHYKIIQPVVLQKDSNAVNLKVVLFKTPDLQTSAKTIWLSLKDGAALKKITRENDVKTSFKLRFSDKLEKPSWWDGYFYSFEYSDIRLQFYIDVLGSASVPSSFPNSIYFVLYKLKTAVLEYNATHPSPLADEFGPISWEIDWINY